MAGLSAVMRRALAEPVTDTPAQKLYEKAERRLRALGDGDSLPLTTRREPSVQVEAYFNPAEHARCDRRGAPAEDLELTGALPILFEFYAKLQAPQAQMASRSLSYAEIQFCNERLSYFEFLCFARDTDVVPALIPKQTLKFVWRLSELHRVKNKNKKTKNHHRLSTTTKEGGEGGGLDLEDIADCGLTMDEFLQVLVLLALVAFAEPAMGHPRLAIDKLAAYLSLHSVVHARTVVRTKGKETQRRLNFRSAGELDPAYGKILLEEMRHHIRQKRAKPKAGTAERNFLEDAITEDQLARLKGQGYEAGDLTSNLASNQLSVLQEVLLAQYDPALADHFRPFCTAHASRTWRKFRGPGLDLGCLEAARRYTARLELRNMSQTMLCVAAFAKRGSKVAPNIKATFDPQPFAPGLTRAIDITLVPTHHAGEFVGCLDVQVAGNHSGKAPVDLAIPVYYTVQSNLDDDDDWDNNNINNNNDNDNNSASSLEGKEEEPHEED